MKVYFVNGTDVAFENKKSARELVDVLSWKRGENSFTYADIFELEVYKNTDDLYAALKEKEERK